MEGSFSEPRQVECVLIFDGTHFTLETLSQKSNLKPTQNQRLTTNKVPAYSTSSSVSSTTSSISNPPSSSSSSLSSASLSGIMNPYNTESHITTGKKRPLPRDSIENNAKRKKPVTLKLKNHTPAASSSPSSAIQTQTQTTPPTVDHHHHHHHHHSSLPSSAAMYTSSSSSHSTDYSIPSHQTVHTSFTSSPPPQSPLNDIGHENDQGTTNGLDLRALIPQKKPASFRDIAEYQQKNSAAQQQNHSEVDDGDDDRSILNNSSINLNDSIDSFGAELENSLPAASQPHHPASIKKPIVPQQQPQQHRPAPVQTQQDFRLHYDSDDSSSDSSDSSDD